MRYRGWANGRMVLPVSIVIDVNGWYADHRDFLDGIRQPWSTLMRSTGLYDKNGVEIFEGDILATEQLDPECDHDVWDDTEWGRGVVSCGVTEGLQVSNSFWLEHDTAEPIESVFDIRFVKVIGNIHQNPELTPT